MAVTVLLGTIVGFVFSNVYLESFELSSNPSISDSLTIHLIV